MAHDMETLDSLRRQPRPFTTSVERPASNGNVAGDEDGEESCLAFGYARGIRDRALTLELRFRNGNTQTFPYGLLAMVSFNPSIGLLLKFTGDLVYLVLIHGSNLDLAPAGRAVNLTDRGIYRHRILWVREMDQDELKKAGRGEPTIDRIEVAECASNEAVTDWLSKHAPAFVPK